MDIRYNFRQKRLSWGARPCCFCVASGMAPYKREAIVQRHVWQMSKPLKNSLCRKDNPKSSLIGSKGSFCRAGRTKMKIPRSTEWCKSSNLRNPLKKVFTCKIMKPEVLDFQVWYYIFLEVAFLALCNVRMTKSETPLKQVGTGATAPQIGIACLKRQEVILRFNKVWLLGSPGSV